MTAAYADLSDMLVDDWTGAPCVGRSEFYDVDALPEGKLAARMRARELCSGCPYIPKCARRAIELNITGMVCGGVPVPRNGRRSAALHALARIAGYRGPKRHREDS